MSTLLVKGLTLAPALIALLCLFGGGLVVMLVETIRILTNHSPFTCGPTHTATGERAGCVPRRVAAGPNYSAPDDLGTCIGGFLTQEQFDALEFQSVEIDFENDGRFPHFALTDGGQTVITVDPSRWRR